MDYIRKHWRGELSLPVAFWVNLFGLGMIARLIEKWMVATGISEDPVFASQVSLTFFVVAVFIIYPWQIVGTWRSADRRRAETGNGGASTLVQVLIVIGFVSTAGTVSMFWSETKESFSIATGNDPFGEYTVSASDDGGLLLIDGAIAFGISDDAREVLETNPNISAAVLTSIGGRLYEGHQLAELFMENSLDTYALDGCYSACVLAFAGGERRFLLTGATLGFHQPISGIAAMNASLEEQAAMATDREYYRARGFEESFLERIFIAGNDEMWYPTIDEMLAANVIHEQKTPSSIGITVPRISGEIVETVLASLPLYKSLKEYAPEEYNRLVEEFSASAARGATQAEMQALASKHLTAMADPLFGKAQDATMMNFASEMVITMEALNATKPAACVAWLFPDQYGNVNTMGTLSEEQKFATLNVLGQIIIDAYTTPAPPIDIASAETVVGNLYVVYEEDLAWLDPSRLSSTADYRRACSGAIAFYQGFLALEGPVAANALRYLFDAE